MPNKDESTLGVAEVGCLPTSTAGADTGGVSTIHVFVREVAPANMHIQLAAARISARKPKVLRWALHKAAKQDGINVKLGQVIASLAPFCVTALNRCKRTK